MKIGTYISNNRYKIVDIKDDKYKLYDTKTTQIWYVTKNELQYLNGVKLKTDDTIEWEHFFKIATENCGRLIYNVFDEKNKTEKITIVGKKIKNKKNKKIKVVDLKVNEGLRMGEKNNNNLLTVANALFGQLEELNKKVVNKDDIQKANAICNVSSQILKTYDVALKVEKHKETRTTNAIGLLGNE